MDRNDHNQRRMQQLEGFDFAQRGAGDRELVSAVGIDFCHARIVHRWVVALRLSGTGRGARNVKTRGRRVATVGSPAGIDLPISTLKETAMSTDMRATWDTYTLAWKEVSAQAKMRALRQLW